MNQKELRLHRCCFTGHRPDKIKMSEKEIKTLLEQAIDNAIADGYVTFITRVWQWEQIYGRQRLCWRERKQTKICT